jgi:hypothetical protein
MPNIHEPKPSLTLRGTRDEIVAQASDIPPGAELEVRVFDAKPDPTSDPTLLLLQSWLSEDSTDDPNELAAAEADLVEFKRTMNLPRKASGARLLFPEVE